MLRYQWYKVIGGALMGVIFAGWLAVLGSSIAMRSVGIGLIAVTAWVVIQSIRDDLARGSNRQLAITNGQLRICTPRSDTQVLLTDVAQACWRDDNNPGLWLYNHRGESIAHIDTVFLASQAEARMFLGWARRQAELPFPVRWPQALTDTTPHHPS
jgi:hypothetical protein